MGTDAVAFFPAVFFARAFHCARGRERKREREQEEKKKKTERI